MSELRFVRQLSPEEMIRPETFTTGDRLSDGSVLLWRDDMDRMGLDALRQWVIEKVMLEHRAIVIADRRDLADSAAPRSVL